MSKTQYTYAVARIRALEASLFSSSTIEQLLACKDETSCLRFLQEKGWGGMDIAMDMDAILSREREKIWENMRQMGIDMSVFAVLSYPNRFHNLKAAIKAVYTGKEDLPVFYEDTDLPKKELLRILKDREYSSLPKNMQAVAKEALEVLLHSGDGQLCDILIDRATLEAVLQAGREADDPVIKTYAELIVEVTNIKIAVRASKTGKSLDFMKRAMVPCGGLNIEKLMMAALAGMDSIIDYLEGSGYGEAAAALKESASAFERWCDNRIIRTMQPQKMNPFSAGPLIAYVIARENEIKTVRIILTCKQNGLPEASIRERIREMYV